MTPTDSVAAAGSNPWICPFCPLACDHLQVQLGGPDLALVPNRGSCARAAESLSRISRAPGAVDDGARIDGLACDIPSAIGAAARILAASRQPLFAGLGTDVAGARALYPLACALGAVCDSAGGDAFMQGVRALQDRGQFTTTLAEVRTRADLIVFVGGLPGSHAPLTLRRCGIGESRAAARHVVLLGPNPGDAAQLAEIAAPGVSCESLPFAGDLFDSVALLAALVAQQSVRDAPESYRTLAARLRGAGYAVLVGTAPSLPPQGALIIETVHAIVHQLNRQTRAAALWVGGGNGAATANQVFTWLSGLPLRSRAGPRGLEHEPLLFGAQRMLDDRAVDALLLVSSFDAGAASGAAAKTGLPMVVLGPPALGAACRRPGAVFIPVSTPGIGSAGHVFRTDGTVLMPLHALYEDRWPTLASVAQGMLQALGRGPRL